MAPGRHDVYLVYSHGIDLNLVFSGRNVDVLFAEKIFIASLVIAADVSRRLRQRPGVNVFLNLL